MLSGLVVAAEPDQVADQYIAMARQGDVRQGLALFESLDSRQSSVLDRDLARKYQTRFVSKDESRPVDSGSVFIDELVRLFFDYWTQSLLGELSIADGTVWLENKLEILLINHDYKSLLEIQPDVMSALGHAIQDQGVYFDRSFASPWYDLLLWKTERRRQYSVELTDQQVPLDVVFMDDFVTLGWSDFATLGMTSSGGWASKDAIYCVSWAWNHDSENFAVSFLKHEGRHFADFQRFPGLDVIDLEYRAKLTELAFATTTLPRVLENFTSNGAPNPMAPHAFANYLVIRDMHLAMFHSEPDFDANPWHSVSPESVNALAAKLLQKHTEKLNQDDASSTTGVLSTARP